MNESNQNSIKYFLSPKTTSKKTLVLDLDETLVHSQFVPFSIKSDLLFKIELENQLHDIHVLIRPGVKKFLQKMGKLYEIVIFTASVSKYADPLLDIIDRNHNCSCRLFREHCSIVGITYIKDLKKLGRDLKDIIIVDNSPLSYSFNHENGLPILTWFNDKNDRELYNITPILEFLSNVYDVRDYIKQIVLNDVFSYDKAIKVIENYSKLKHDDSNNKYIEEIISNKNNNNISNEKLNDNFKENYSYDKNEKFDMNHNIITDKKDKKNYVNITISNNAINNYLYFSPIYNINNSPIENNISNNNEKIPINNNCKNNIEVKINTKLIQQKENILNTKTMRTKSKGLLNKITINKKAKNESNNFKKIKYISKNNINKNIKEKIDSAGNKSINYCIKMNNSEIKELNLNHNILDLKTIIPGKKNNSKDYKLPKTPEIEEILSPLHEKIDSSINNRKTFSNLHKQIFQAKRGNSSDKNKNEKYKFRNSLNKFNNQINPSSIINHEKHKSFNYYTPFNFEHNMVNSLKKNNLNNYAFFEQISNHTCKNNSHSNNKYIKGIKQNKINSNNNTSLNLINKNYRIVNDLNNQIKKNNINKKSKISLINNYHKKVLNNQFKIIGITEYNKQNKTKKLINFYNLIIQNSNSYTINNNNYKKINSTNRTINTDSSFNYSFKDYNNSTGSNNFKTINNNNLNKTNLIITNKKLFNNSIFKNKKSIKKYKTNTNKFFNYDKFIRHKKTLSFNGTGINSHKLIIKANSSSFSQEQKNLKDKKNNHKELYIHNTNIINNSKNKTIIKTKREINDGLMNKKISNKIARIKEIKFISIYEKITHKNNNKININSNNENIIYNLIDNNNNSNLNRLKKYVKIGVKKIVND
jgi:RNA polymerase II subunit A small phosphatase-like protein